MPNTQPAKKSNTRLTALIILGFLAITILTNPSENGFRKYLQQYIETNSGSTMVPKENVPVPIIFRQNYYLFSNYETNIDGVKHNFVGMYGTFRHL